MKKLNKLFFVLFLFCTSNSFAVYVYSLTNTHLITPVINSTVSIEMTNIITSYKELELFFKNNINVALENKKFLSEKILEEKALNNTLLKEIQSLNSDIESTLFLKRKIK